MQEYTVNLANGQTYTIRASSPAEAARLANADAQESGNEVVNVTRLGSTTPITTKLPTGEVVSFTGADPSLTGTSPFMPKATAVPSPTEEAKRLESERLEAERLEAERLRQAEAERQAAAQVAGQVAGPTPAPTPTIGGLPLGEVDPYAIFTKALGMQDRPLTDPYRRYMGSMERMFEFFNPFRFESLLGNRPGAQGLFGEGGDPSVTNPLFEDYLALVTNPLQARQNAADLFARSVQGGFGAEHPATTLLGSLIGDQGQFSSYGALGPDRQKVLDAFGSLGQQALQNRIGSAAFNLFAGPGGRSLPSVKDVYTDYFTKAQAGQQVAPTFGQALQGAYGLGG